MGDATHARQHLNGQVPVTVRTALTSKEWGSQIVTT